MTHSRRATRVAALGAAVAVTLSGLALTMPAAASAAAPAAPQSLSPDSLNQLKNVELTWAGVRGAISYEVRLVDADDVTTTATTVYPRWTLPTSTPRGEYEWSVRARTAAGWSSWSAAASVVHGWSAQPSNARADAGLVPTYTWDPVADASFYEVEISDRAFSTYPETQSGRSKRWTCYTTQTTLAPYGISAGADKDPAPGAGDCVFTSDPDDDSTLSTMSTHYVPGTTYFWRVRGRDGSVDARRTEFADPTVGCTGVWDDAGAEIDDAGGITVPIGQKPPTYEATPACSQWAIGNSVTASTFAPAPLSTPTGLTVSPTTDQWSAALDATVTASPVFSWNAVPGAFKYRVYLSRTSDVLDSDVIWETQTNRLAPVSDLALSTTGKYWTVQACFVQCSAPAAVHKVRKRAASTVVPLSLTAAADGSTLFATWKTQDQGVRGAGFVAPRAAAKYYEVRATNLETGVVAQTVKTDRVAASWQAGTSHLLLTSSGYPEGLYSFAVRGVTETGRGLPWSAESVSRIIDRANPTVRLTSASGFLGRTPVRLTFSEPVTNVSASTLGVKSPSGARVAGTVQKLSATVYSFTPRSSWVPGSYVEAWTSGAVDRAGKLARTTATSTQLRAGTTLDSTSSQLRFVTGDAAWRTRTSSSAYGKSYRVTADKASTSRRSYVSTSVYGTSVKVGFCKSPTSATALVYVDGRLQRTVSLYQSSTQCGSTSTISGLPVGTHAVKVVARASGRRTAVAVDRITVG